MLKNPWEGRLGFAHGRIHLLRHVCQQSSIEKQRITALSVAALLASDMLLRQSSSATQSLSGLEVAGEACFESDGANG